MSLKSRLSSRLRHMAHARFKEPVVVIESDDWGMIRHSGNFDQIQDLGKLKSWAYDDLESESDLEDLYQVFESFKDALGNPYKLTPNFIVANPDFEKTAQSNYQEIVLEPITEHRNSYKWKEGLDRKVFWPQYHGRFHFNRSSILHGLQKPNSAERRLFDAGFHGGLNNLATGDWNDHSEYIWWKRQEELPLPELNDWIKGGLDIFEQLFGFRSKSVIAPHYVYTAHTAKAFRLAGFKYVQGGNHQIFPDRHGKQQMNKFPIGSHCYQGLTILSRNVKFEPTRGNENWDVGIAYKMCLKAFENGIPAIIDSHRINYTGRHKDEGLEKLHRLLEKLQPHQPAVLSSDELGQAIDHKGEFTSNSSGETARLTSANLPISNFYRDKIR